MTKLQALRECYKMWSELAENGNRRKPETEFENNCPICQYTLDKYGEASLNKKFEGSGINCKKCILLPIWNVGPKSLCPCESRKSPYKKWQYSKGYDIGLRKRSAMIIADFCKNEIKKMRKGV
jgi:hypothetical protein